MLNNNSAVWKVFLAHLAICSLQASAFVIESAERMANVTAIDSGEISTEVLHHSGPIWGVVRQPVNMASASNQQITTTAWPGPGIPAATGLGDQGSTVNAAKPVELEPASAGKAEPGHEDPIWWNNFGRQATPPNVKSIPAGKGTQDFVGSKTEDQGRPPGQENVTRRARARIAAILMVTEYQNGNEDDSNLV